MTKKKHSLSNLEFYITNVCNFNCTDCNRGNNFNFKGHQRWDEYQDAVRAWSTRLQPDKIGILGGEPMMNPDFEKWLINIANLWPESRIKIITNGSQFNRWPKLYEIMAETNGRMQIKVNCHNIDYRDHLIQTIENFYPGDYHQSITDYHLKCWKDGYDAIKDPSWPTCDYPTLFIDLPQWIQQECELTHHFSWQIWQKQIDQDFIDHRGVAVHFIMGDVFANSTIRHNAVEGTLALHNSDPIKAMEVCGFKKCHHISKGKLYKCGPTAILPDFINQFDIDLTDHQRYLIETYQPAEPEWSDQLLSNFCENLRLAEPIAQCSLCPETKVLKKFKATNKKIKWSTKSRSE